MEYEIEDVVRMLNSRSILSEEGKYKLKVTSINRLTEPQDRGNGNVVTHIANFNAMNTYHQGEAMAAIDAGDFTKALNQNLSLGLRAGKDYLPTKGEIVDVLVSEVEVKAGGTALLANSILEIKSKTPTAKVNFSKYLEATPVEAEEDENSLSEG